MAIPKVAQEIEAYFVEQYGKSQMRVVPGHWPEMKTKKDVDKWLEKLATIKRAFSLAFTSKNVFFCGRSQEEKTLSWCLDNCKRYSSCDTAAQALDKEKNCE